MIRSHSSRATPSASAANASAAFPAASAAFTAASAAFTAASAAFAFLAAAILIAPVPARAQADVWMKLFSGNDFNGWKYRPASWKVDAAAGSAIGSGAVNFNTFLITDSLYNDFHFKVDARMPGTGGGRNSGVVYRGKISNAANFQVSGYQVDISDNYWGSFYHEQGSELPWTPVSNCSPAARTDWATLEIIANKDKVTHLVNGKTCWEHSGFKVLDKGIIALQLHSPGDFSVEFKNVYIKPLNASFTIPPDRAYDKDGKPLFVVGINLAPKSGRAGASAAAGMPGYYFDAEGRRVSVSASRSAASRAPVYGKYFQAR